MPHVEPLDDAHDLKHPDIHWKLGIEKVPQFVEVYLAIALVFDEFL